MKYLLSCLITISFFSSSAAQLISFRPFSISFTRGAAQKKWWYNSNTCDSLFQKSKPSGTGWSSDKLTFITYWQDNDEDGYGNAAVPQTSCHTLQGFVTNSADCNDNNNTVWELNSYYIDADGDGWTVGTAILCSGTTIPAGYSDHSLGTDCDDLNALISTSNQFYKDKNGDGFADSDSLFLICSGTPPTGYTASNFIPVVQIEFTIRGTLNLNLHGLSMETGHVDTRNIFIDWNASLYFNRCLQYNAPLYSWAGSSRTHSLYHPSGDTIAQGTGRIGNGVNGKFNSWKSDPSNPIQAKDLIDAAGGATPYRRNDSILNGVNRNFYAISFFPYAVDFLVKVHSKMVYQTNATPYSWTETKNAISYLRRKEVWSGMVCAGMELTGCNYSNCLYFPAKTGGTTYMNTVGIPLHDSLAIYFPNSTVILDCDDAQKPASKWNEAIKPLIARDSTYAVRAYFTQEEIGYVAGQKDEDIQSNVIARLDAYRNYFEGNPLYIAQWQFSDSFLTAFFEKIIIEYAADHPNYILACTFNGMKNLNFSWQNTDASYPGLVKSGQLFYPDAITLTAKSNVTSLSAIATKGTDGKLTIEYLNRKTTPVTINYISVDGFITAVKQTANANSITIIK